MRARAGMGRINAFRPSLVWASTVTLGMQTVLCLYLCCQFGLVWGMLKQTSLSSSSSSVVVMVVAVVAKSEFWTEKVRVRQGMSVSHYSI